MTKLENSEKHPIDALFATGFAGHDLKPSAAADSLFAKALNDRHKAKEKKRIFPFWTTISIAASIALAIGFYWSFSVNNVDATLADSQLATPIITNESSNPVDEDMEEATPKSLAMIEHKNASNKQNNAKSFPTKTSKLLMTPLEKEVNVTGLTATGVYEIDELIPDKLTLALQKAQKQATKSESLKKNSSQVFQKDIGETIIIVSSNLDTTKEIYLPEINEDSPISLAQAEELGEAKRQSEFSLIAKVFTEIKHLKHGEKVDIPNLVASNETDDLGFLAQETYELKERISWVKNRITGK